MGRRKKEAQIIDGVEHWVCGKCRTPKVPDDFGIHKNTTNGLQGTCKACRGITPKPIAVIGVDGVKKYYCHRCKGYKFPEEMGIRRASENGLNCYCLDCLVIRQQKQWDKDIDHSRAMSRASSIRSYDNCQPRRKQKSRPYEWSIERAARDAVREAVYKGRIVKPERCERCGDPTPKKKLHGHHHDYTKKLDVQWCCPKCHGKDRRLSPEETRTNRHLAG